MRGSGGMCGCMGTTSRLGYILDEDDVGARWLVLGMFGECVLGVCVSVCASSPSFTGPRVCPSWCARVHIEGFASELRY